MNELRDVSKMTDSERQVEEAVDAKRRADNCLIGVQNELKKWNCKIEPIMTFSSMGIQANWGIAPMMVVKIQ